MINNINNNKNKKNINIAIILSGCGQHDGSEIQETISLILALEKHNINYQAFAPNRDQLSVINALNLAEMAEKRNILVESARLVRGKIKAIDQINLIDLKNFNFDGLIFPGGLGFLSNLCEWRENNKIINFNSKLLSESAQWFARKIDFDFCEDIKNIVDYFIKNNKLLGFICIAPLIIPKLFPNAKYTLGNQAENLVNYLAKTTGNKNHENISATEIVIDKNYKIISTPANMCAKNITEVYQGIDKLVGAIIEQV